MSRLFSRLENMGQDQAEGAQPDGPRPWPGDMPAGAAGPAPVEFGSTSPGSTPGDTPPISLPVPGYSILSSLSRPALPEISVAIPAPPVVAASRPLWPTRAWLASLLLLVGLSLLVLAMPERPRPLKVQQAPTAVGASVNAVPAVPAASATAVHADRPALPSASPVVNAVPAARRPRTPVAAAVPSPSTPIATAPTAPAATAPSAGSAACSEAMLAMNLCSKPSP
ncbi:MAG: hypothetical protein JWM30_3261 [Burkholderia sp.]|nr:hypothetical protein [Burkholderia sp.]